MLREGEGIGGEEGLCLWMGGFAASHWAPGKPTDPYEYTGFEPVERDGQRLMDGLIAGRWHY